jgi:hypothetical protein
MNNNINQNEQNSFLLINTTTSMPSKYTLKTVKFFNFLKKHFFFRFTN